ncbi:MAG: ATP-binding protein [candidate division Zixibacteria bacterium]|nr:ATP-binding protein [candidate division Zixibacteria bacterium]
MDKPVISGDTIVIPSDQEFLADVDVFLEGTLRGLGVDESIIADIAISVSELVNNAIIHGNKFARSKSVTIKMAHNGRTLTISVIDQGTGFDPGHVPDPLSQENLLKEVGRGIFIVRQLMEKVDIIPSPHGTTIAITKSF